MNKRKIESAIVTLFVAYAAIGNPQKIDYYKNTIPSKQITKQLSIEKKIKKYNSEEEGLFARALYGEIRGNYSILLKQAIANVAINRVNDKKNRWPKNIEGVLLQKNQYSVFNKKDPNYEKVINPHKDDPQAWRNLTNNLDTIIYSSDPTKGANHYHTDAVSPRWARRQKPLIIFKEGGKNFYFYKL